MLQEKKQVIAFKGLREKWIEITVQRNSSPTAKKDGRRLHSNHRKSKRINALVEKSATPTHILQK